MADLKQLDVEAGFATTKSFTGQVDLFTQLRATLSASADNALNEWKGKSRVDFLLMWEEIMNQIASLSENLQTISNNLNAELQQVQEAFSN